jgi:hypothetical protein
MMGYLIENTLIYIDVPDMFIDFEKESDAVR